MTASDGFVYEAEELRKLIGAHGASPMTMEELRNEYIPAEQKKKELDTFCETRAGELLDFAEETLLLEPAMSKIALEKAQDYLNTLGAKQSPLLAKRIANCCHC